MHEDLNVFVSPTDSPTFWVWMSGKSYCDSTYSMDRPCAETCVLEYIVKGKGTLELDGEKFTPKAGDMYILPLGSHQKYASSADEPWEKIFVNLQGSAIPSFLKAYKLNNQILFNNCESLYPIFLEIFNKTKENLPTDTIMEECCMLLHKLLMRLTKKIQENKEIPEEVRIVKDYIESHLSEEISMDELSSLIYRSNDYTNKVFRKYYGIPPYTYYLNKRVDMAKVLLTNTALNIKQIAARLGYKESHYFSKQFHLLTGMTPKEYRTLEKIRKA